MTVTVATARIMGTVPGSILIADDDNVGRKLLRRLLEEDGRDARDASYVLRGRASPVSLWAVAATGLR